jgi:Predicted membrane protein (DUF2232)
MNILAIGIGAGLVSALLFGVVITGSPLAMGLSLVAPLPIFISSLGWHHRSGLVAVLAGGVAMALALNSTAGIAFSLGWALPAWWLAYLALLGRPRDGQVEWYPLGRLLLWIAGTAALITLIGAVALGDGSHDLYQENLRRAFDTFVQVSTPTDRVPAPESVAFVFLAALPFFFAFNFVLILVLNLWLSAKVVQVSGRLPRPWPFIPAISLPKLALLLTGAAVLAGFVPGFPGVAGLALGGALLSAFALQGFAVIHDLTRGRPARTILLTGIYAIAFLVSQLVLPLLAVLGAVDAATSLRRRLHNGPSQPPTHRTGT